MIRLLFVICIVCLCAGEDGDTNILAGLMCQPGLEITFIDRSRHLYLMVFEFDDVNQLLWANELSVELPSSWLKKVWKEDYPWYSLVRRGRNVYDVIYLNESSGQTQSLYHLKTFRPDDDQRRSIDHTIYRRNETIHVVVMIEYFSCETSFFSYFYEMDEKNEPQVYMYDYQRRRKSKKPLSTYKEWKENSENLPKYLISMVQLPGKDQFGVIIYDDDQWKYGSLNRAINLQSLTGPRRNIPFRRVKPDGYQ